MVKSSSFMQKFIFDKLPVKGAVVVLDDVWQVIASQRPYPDPLQRIVGELLAANSLLISNLKLDGKIVCQIQDNPHFDLVVSECSSTLNVRATGKFNSSLETNQLDYASYLNSGGRLVVSIDSATDGQLYQSVIAFNGNNIAEILNNYMLQSEQLRTWFLLAYSQERVVGFVLQQLPDMQNQFVEDIERVFMLANTLSTHELLVDSPEKILHKLFSEDDIILFEDKPMNFSCTCSRARVGQILRNLGKEELENMIAEEGDITVNCDYCNTEYHFKEQELEQFVLQISLDEMNPISKQIN